jgi:hypothetical protein
MQRSACVQTVLLFACISAVASVPVRVISAMLIDAHGVQEDLDALRRVTHLDRHHGLGHIDDLKRP